MEEAGSQQQEQGKKGEGWGGGGNSLVGGRAGARGRIRTRVRVSEAQHRRPLAPAWKAHAPGGQVAAAPEARGHPQLGLLGSLRTQASHHPLCPAPRKGPLAPKGLWAPHGWRVCPAPTPAEVVQQMQVGVGLGGFRAVPWGPWLPNGLNGVSEGSVLEPH